MTMAPAAPDAPQTAEEQAAALLEAISSFPTFLRRWVQLDDATSQRTIPWEWWAVHDEMTADLLARRLVVLKARQLGWSWLLAAYAVHGAMFRRHYAGLLLSQGEDEAVKLLAKCRSIWANLPDWMRPSLSTDNTTDLVFAVSGGSLSALPATKRAGRGSTASLVIVDEAAFHPWATENYAAYKPTVDAGGQLIVVSTANGAGGFFHSLYTEGRNGSNGFAARFYGWRSRPGRDDAWYEQQRLEWRHDPGKLAQEYPSTDAEAFVMSGNQRFDREAVRQGAEAAALRQPLPYSAWPTELQDSIGQNNGLTLWQRPQASQPYVAGSDVAEGLARGDYSCTVVLNARTLEHAATLHGHWEPSEFARLSDALCRSFGGALWGIERNNHGHAVLLAAKEVLHYPRLYWHADALGQTNRQLVAGALPTKRLGWPTTTGTKPALIDGLAELIAAYALPSPDAGFWSECQTYVREANGSTGAAEGCHDDRVMALAIARRMAQEPGATTVRAGLTTAGGVGTGAQANGGDSRPRPRGGYNAAW